MQAGTSSVRCRALSQLAWMVVDSKCRKGRLGRRGISERSKSSETVLFLDVPHVHVGRLCARSTVGNGRRRRPRVRRSTRVLACCRADRRDRLAVKFSGRVASCSRRANEPSCGLPVPWRGTLIPVGTRQKSGLSQLFWIMGDVASLRFSVAEQRRENYEVQMMIYLTSNL